MTRAELERLIAERYIFRAAIPEVAGWSLNLQTNRVTWSPGIYRILGLPVQSGLRPRGLAAELMDADSYAAFEAELRRCMNVEGATFEVTASIAHGAGGRIHARIKGTTVFLEGRPAHIQGTMTPIRNRQVNAG